MIFPCLLPKSKISSVSESSSIPDNITENLHMCQASVKNKRGEQRMCKMIVYKYRYLADVEELEYLHLEAEAGVHQQEHQVRHLQQGQFVWNTIRQVVLIQSD
jgi:hypothetical protein